MTDLVLSSAAPGARDGLAYAAAIAVAAARSGRGPALLAAFEAEPQRRSASLLAAPEARDLEAELRAAEIGPVSARGHICRLGLPAEKDSLLALAEFLERDAAGTAVAQLPGGLWTEALACSPSCRGGLLRAELPRDRPLAALVVAELRRLGLRARVATRALGPIAARRALAGLDPGGAASARTGRLADRLLDSRGQAMPLMLGAVVVLMTVMLVLLAVGGAVTAKGRAQRAADLAAVSSVRSMRDDLPRLLAPAVLPNGLPNPYHLPKPLYLARAIAAGRDAARRNGIAQSRVGIQIPDALKPAPIQARAEVRGEVEGERIDVLASATAEAAPPGGGWTGMPAAASGGGYSGPLAYRQGEGMRPDVAAAFDLMSAAAAKAGIELTVNSGFRSDAEQAVLFAAHPDPTWVAPPGQSLHRCATELDLGSSSAYGWLAANANRFGFVQRYSWEAWHYGFNAGPAPCSEAGNSVTASGSGDGERGGEQLPSFVPAAYRDAISRAAARRGVSAALLAAQIEAESGFNPHAVSPAGAQGIAQFMPGTAASYGLRDPFDPEQAIDAQARLMADLLREFGSIPLALAGYNAGAGAVGGCNCIPYAETRAYVTRILALLGGAGSLGGLTAAMLEVRLVK